MSKHYGNKTHIDLFSGIGGFTLAAQWAGFRTVVFCEKDEFCQKILRKHWSDIPIIPEIKDFDGTKWKETTLLTGGFPCQPVSCAGKRRGKEDDRYLWPEMFRVIKEARPHWVFAENVAGIISMGLDSCLADLEGEGYPTGTIVVPACAKNAPHRRDRVWIIAHDTRRKKSRRISSFRRKKISKIGQTNSHASDSPGERLSGLQENQFEQSLLYAQRRSWEEDWTEVATRFCGVADGIPDRIHRLKALGNAIVPAIAYEIIKRIGEIERNRNI